MKRYAFIAIASLCACDSKPTPAGPNTAATAPATTTPPAPAADATPEAPKGPTAEDALAFVADVNTRLLALKARAETAEYIKATYITPDTEIIGAQANEVFDRRRPTHFGTQGFVSGVFIHKSASSWVRNR